jgi:mono/diheme cytochrome c family protein
VAQIPRDVDAAGDTLFQNYCAVCHGGAGDAKGTVSARIGASSLLTSRARAYSDGYIYSIIRYGRGVMPRYGDKVYLPFDRWAIVNHVRKLQSRSPAPQEPPAAAVGIPPTASALGSTGGRPK